MATNQITMSNFFNGGISDSKWSGLQDSLYRMVGLDPHSEPAVLKAEQALDLDSGSVVTELVKYQVVSTNGRTYHFSSESGKIWERTSGGTWSLVHTTVPAAGEAKCLGAIEFNGYIIWATESRLHRILASGALGAAQWTANKVLNWQTFTNTNKSFHPMIIQNLILYIGDGNYLAQYDADDDVFTPDALDLESGYVISALGKLGTDVVIGTKVDGNRANCSVFRWNTWSVSFTTADELPEVGVHAFIQADNYLYLSAGYSGNIYSYDGNVVELYRKIQGTYSPTQKCQIFADATANLDGNVLIGVSNNAGNPCPQGVYRIGRHSRNYPYILDLAYPISLRSGTDLVTSSISIGSIVTVGQQILVSWKSGTTCGVDILDPDNKCDGAYFETRVMRPDRLTHSTFSEFVMAYNSLPASTALTLYYDKNYAGSYTTPTSSQTVDVDRKIISLEEGLEATALQLKVVFGCYENTTPSLESLDVFLT